MQQSWRSLFLITLPLAILGSLGSINLVRAQITPDNTLGAGNSVVNHNVDVGKGIPSDQIEGGARRGANLFHSFQEFNIEAGRGAYFSNPNGVANIITRVTGGNGSDIQGTLGVLGNANLFFINPNGINFGKNARLDLSGSFLASTANSLVFENGLEFSATNPQAPPLLAVNIPIGLRFRDNPGKITVKGSGQNLWLNGAFSSFDNPTLAVQAGQNLTLVGGNVSLGGKASSDVVDGGVLQAPGGRVELGGLTAAGVVNLNTDGSLSFPDGVARADVSLTNQAGINVIAGQQGGGSININARNIKISGESLLTARIAGGLGTVNTQAGDIKLNATGETRIDQSRIENIVNLQATAKRSGNINITTSNLSLTNGAQLDTSTFGTGDAGNVTIQASDTVSVSGGAQVLARNAGGTGDAGSIKITAKDKVCIAGFQNNGDATVATDVASGGKGNGNSLTINAPQVEIKDEAIVTASIINGKGKDGGLAQAGDVNINATQKVSIDNSQVFSEVGNSNYSRGNGGSIIIEAPSVSLDHGASLTTRIRLLSEGNGGNIKIKTGSLSLKNGSKLVTSTSAQGNAGNVTIQASNSVSFDGVSKQENRFLDLNDISGGKLSSGVFSIVQAGATGHGGNIEINTGTLSVSGGAQVLARNAGGTGDAGSIKITAADKVSIAGFQNNGDATVGTDVVHGGKGNGNSLTINAPQVEIKDQSKISASTSSTGDAGNVTINTRELLAQDGAQVNASTSGAGAGGSLTV
ncbi:MAG: filamentous hemagglutinin N-terminal domain-containing protein, partial [Stigonema ocellatum SAG 48.90 = DSM 106950]|nr:filamentous hemagglutinin N-terminal domain-containing protein [Stigonema ocellatum SAG 48.90 = DSM 106950]